MIYSTVFISGFCLISIELLGGRMLSPYFGNSIYVWGSIIGVFMLALSLGYLLGGVISSKKSSMTIYSSMFIAAGFLSLTLIPFSDFIMSNIVQLIKDPRYGSLMASLVLFLPCTVPLGAISPYSVKLKIISLEKSGHTAGKLYFVSTLGSTLGTIMTAFYLILWLEVKSIIILLSVILISTGVVLIIKKNHA